MHILECINGLLGVSKACMLSICSCFVAVMGIGNGLAKLRGLATAGFLRVSYLWHFMAFNLYF